MTSSPRELVSTIVLSFIVTLSSASGMCQAPPEGRSSYGKQFVIPFPHVVTPVSAAFEYRVYVTNPNTSPVGITLVPNEGAISTTQTSTVPINGSLTFRFNSSFMMIGQGIFPNGLNLSADNDVGVHILTTEKMDGCTLYPVNSWGYQYMIVAHCGFNDELCQVVIVVNQTSQVRITLPDQGANSISYVTTPLSELPITLTIQPGQVYQLQRNFDITGARITSDVPIGVLSGAANATVGSSSTSGAFMEQMPPIGSAGTDYIVPQTPGQSATADFVRVVALQDVTTVFIWSDTKRFSMNSSQFITRRLTNHMMLIESDKPIMVVKFSQSSTDNVKVRYPTMSVIVPTDSFLTKATFVVVQVTDATDLEQYVIVVQSNTSEPCVSQLDTFSNYSTPGTDLTAYWYPVTTTGVFYLSCSSSAIAYSSMVSSGFSAQFPIAFNLRSTYCVPTQGSPGDAIDNDCDGQVDEDVCTTYTSNANADCGPVISGDRDVYGKSFTFLIPYNSDKDGIMLLFASYDLQKDVMITISTPLNPTLVNMTTTISAGQNHTSINISNTGVIANGSRFFENQTVHVAADNEISVTLVVVSLPINTLSGLSVLVIPDDVLGQEYFIATISRNKSNCTIQITALHVKTTMVKIRLRLPNPDLSLLFEGQEFHAGQLICVELEQYQSLQIQAPLDLSGTHIISNKPVSVWSGGILTFIGSSNYKDSISEHLPPIVSWGQKFFVRLSEVYLRGTIICRMNLSACTDYLKIVASAGNTVVNIVYNSTLQDNYTLISPGDFLEILMKTRLQVIKADKPVLVVQILQSYQESEPSASYVAPVEQYLTSDRIVFPQLFNVTVRQLLITYSFTDPTVSDLLAGEDSIVMDNSTFLEAGSAVYNSSTNFTFLRGEPRFPIGGYVFVTETKKTMLHPIAFAMNKTNLACEISKSQPGDGKDNDCDGNVDEEDCYPKNLPQDNDIDGMVNEDCKLPPITSSLPSDSATAFYSTPSLDHTTSDGLTSTTDQVTSYSQDVTTSFFQDLTTGHSLDLSTSYSQALTTSYSQDLTTSYLQYLHTSYPQDLTTSYSHATTTGYSQDSTSKSVPEFSETLVLVSTTDHTSKLTTSLPQQSITFVSPSVTSSAWPEMTSSHGIDSVVTTDMKSITGTLDSVYPTSISYTESGSQSTTPLAVSSTKPSSDTLSSASFSSSLTGRTPSSTSSTSTSAISPSSSTQSSTVSSSSSALAPTMVAYTTASISHTNTASSSSTTATAVLSSHPCGCLCPSNVLTSRLQSSLVDSLKSSIQKTLGVDKSELSATTRKLISINDQRPSAQTIGFFGVTLVIVAFSSIILLDSGILIRNITKLIKKCKRKK